MTLCVELGSDNIPYVQLGEYKLRLDLEDLNEEYQERARLELRETPENVEGALVALRGLIKGNHCHRKKTVIFLVLNLCYVC